MYDEYEYSDAIFTKISEVTSLLSQRIGGAKKYKEAEENILEKN